MSELEWDSFKVRIDVNASLSNIYNCWTTRQGLERWFLRVAEFRNPEDIILLPEESVAVGYTYKWLWYGWPDDTVEYGKILAMNGENFLKFSFGKAGDCSVHIIYEEGQTVVELIQENIPTDEPGKLDYHVGCKTGWSFYLANLKSVLEGGIDLRNRNEELLNVVNS